MSYLHLCWMVVLSFSPSYRTPCKVYTFQSRIRRICHVGGSLAISPANTCTHKHTALPEGCVMHAVRPDKWKCRGRCMSWCLDLPSGMGILPRTALSPDEWSHSRWGARSSEATHQVFKRSSRKKKRSCTKHMLLISSWRISLTTTSDKSFQPNVIASSPLSGFKLREHLSSVILLQHIVPPSKRCSVTISNKTPIGWVDLNMCFP